jgi:putative NADPH-quinone reductase
MPGQDIIGAVLIVVKSRAVVALAAVHGKGRTRHGCVEAAEFPSAEDILQDHVHMLQFGKLIAAHPSDQLIDELLSSDLLIIACPIWNFGTPSTLKTWIDHVVRAGKTFNYGGVAVGGVGKR